MVSSASDVEVKLISNGLDGEGVYSALCGNLIAISDPLKRKAMCMMYLAFVFGNDYCLGMNQVCEAEKYAGSNLPLEQQQKLQREMLNAAAGVSYHDSLYTLVADQIEKRDFQ